MSADECLAAKAPEVLLAAMELADDAVVILDGERRITHFNAAAERIWKRARADVLGRDAGILELACLHADAAVEFRDEVSIMRPDGSWIRAAVSLSPVATDDANSQIVFARDVTEDAERR